VPELNCVNKIASNLTTCSFIDVKIQAMHWSRSDSHYCILECTLDEYILILQH
jgi:hypothetical protein